MMRLKPKWLKVTQRPETSVETQSAILSLTEDEINKVSVNSSLAFLQPLCNQWVGGAAVHKQVNKIAILIMRGWFSID